MAEFPPSPVHRPSRRPWLPALTAAVGLVVGIAIVKPWGEPASSRPPDGLATFTLVGPARSAEAAVDAVGVETRGSYDPRLFGSREPDPAWELWPAGYVVEFGIAGPLPVQTQLATPGARSTASSTPSSATSSLASAGLGDGGPPAAPVIDLGSADHIVALGINTPSEIRVAQIGLQLFRGDGCCEEDLPYVRLPTLWDSQHFFVIGIADPERPGRPGRWPIGDYRLWLLLRDGEVRSVAFRVTAPLG